MSGVRRERKKEKGDAEIISTSNSNTITAKLAELNKAKGDSSRKNTNNLQQEQRQPISSYRDDPARSDDKRYSKTKTKTHHAKGRNCSSGGMSSSLGIVDLIEATGGEGAFEFEREMQEEEERKEGEEDAGNNRAATMMMRAMKKELSEVDLQQIGLMDKSGASSDDNYDYRKHNNNNTITHNNKANKLSKRKSTTGSILRTAKKLLMKKEKTQEKSKEERYSMLTNSMTSSRMSSSSLALPYDLERGTEGGGEKVFGLEPKEDELNTEQEEEERAEEVEICFFEDEQWMDELDELTMKEEDETNINTILDNHYNVKDNVVEFDEDEDEDEDEDKDVEEESCNNVVNNNTDDSNIIIMTNNNNWNENQIQNEIQNKNQNQSKRNKNNNSNNTNISFCSEDEVNGPIMQDDSGSRSRSRVTNTLRYRVVRNICYGTGLKICSAGMGLVLLSLLCLLVGRAVHISNSNNNNSLRGGQQATNTTAATAATSTTITVGYSEYNWNELPLPVQNASMTLGWNQQLWNRNQETDLYQKEWQDLTQKQQTAAALLGFNQGTWCTDNDDNYNHHHHNNDDEDDKDNEKDEDRTTDVSSTIVPETTTTTTDDDLWYREETWKELPPEIQQAASALGYTPEIWDTPGATIPLDIFDAQWEQLTRTEQKKAALLFFGYTEETWIDDPVWEEEYSEQIMTQLNLKEQQSSSSASASSSVVSTTPADTAIIPDTTTTASATDLLAGLLYCPQWDDLDDKLHAAAVILGYTKETWCVDDEDAEDTDAFTEEQPSTTTSVGRVPTTTTKSATTTTATTTKKSDEEDYWIDLPTHHHHRLN